MKTKLSLVAFVFLPSLAFSCTGTSYKYMNHLPQTYTSGFDCRDALGYISYARDGTGNCKMTVITGCTDIGGGVYTQNQKYAYTVSSSTPCPDGTIYDPAKYACVPSCSTTFDYSTWSCTPPPFSAFDGDQAACENAGYYYFNDGVCTDGAGAIAKIFQDPLAVSGSFLVVNGLAWTAAGLFLGATPIGAATALTWGAYATLAGVGSIAVSAGSQLASSPDSATPVNDVTLDDGTRLKVSTDQFDNTQIVKADTTTGKIDAISTIPPEVKQRIIDGVVNPTTGLPNTPFQPSDFAGTKSTTFDYNNNTATTQTVQSDGTIKTETTPITTVLNPNGSVTTTAVDTSVSPTVTGTTSSTLEVPDWTQYSSIAPWTQSTADDSGFTTGTTQTGGGSTGGTSTGTDPVTGDETFGELELDDGRGKFGDMTDSISLAFDDYEDPRPLNLECSSNLNIDPIYFDLMGRRFTLLDNEMLSNVPVDLFRAILMFVAGVSALILIFSGGI